MILLYDASIQPVTHSNIDGHVCAEHSNCYCRVIATTEQEANDAIAEFKNKRGDRRAILRGEQIAKRDVDFMNDTVVWRATVRFLRFNNVLGNMMELDRCYVEPVIYGFPSENPAP